MYYLNGRYYNPEIGRFISSDGLLGQVGDTLSNNMYAYCANNLVMYSNITGYTPEWLKTAGIVGAIVGTVLVVAAITVLTCGVGTTVLAGTLAGAIIHGAAVLIVVGITMVVLSGGSLAAIMSPYLAQFLGTVFLPAGGGSLVGGLFSENQYGNFQAGWNSGFITGTIAGIGLGVGGLAFACENYLSGLVFAGMVSAGGNYLGTKYKQNYLGYTNNTELIANTIIGGTLSFIGVSFAFGTTIIADAGQFVVAGIYGIIVEGVIDISSYGSYSVANNYSLPLPRFI